MAINTARLSNFVGMICQVTQLLVSYNPRTMNTVEELQQVDRQTTRSRQKTARRPVAKKRDRPIDSAVCSLFKENSSI